MNFAKRLILHLLKDFVHSLDFSFKSSFVCKIIKSRHIRTSNCELRSGESLQVSLTKESLAEMLCLVWQPGARFSLLKFQKFQVTF